MIYCMKIGRIKKIQLSFICLLHLLGANPELKLSFGQFDLHHHQLPKRNEKKNDILVTENIKSFDSML